jgi:hypothetical protein
LPSPKGAMEMGGEMGDGSMVSGLDFEKDFVDNGAMEVVGQIIKTSRAKTTKPAIVLRGGVHSVRSADTIEEKTDGCHCLVVPNTAKKSED